MKVKSELDNDKFVKVYNELKIDTGNMYLIIIDLHQNMIRQTIKTFKMLCTQLNTILILKFQISILSRKLMTCTITMKNLTG